MGADNVHATKGERMYDTGSTTFMLVCTMLVFLMTPGLAFFYGGLSRRKNVINTMLMCFGAIGLVGVLWIVAGWSLAYGGDGSSPFIGGLDQLLCLPVLNQVLQAAEGNAADGAAYPQIINIAFQMAFAMITAAIVTGSLAGRVKFGAMTAFLGIWLLVVYAPLAHMVWGRRWLLYRRHHRRTRLCRRRRGTHFVRSDGPDSLLNARPSSWFWHGELPSA